MADDTEVTGAQVRMAQQGRRNRPGSGLLIGVAIAAAFVFFLWQQTAGSPALPAGDVPDPAGGQCPGTD